MIFVQIASYRDKQLVPTIIDCIKKARYPNDLVFGIIDQLASGDPTPLLPQCCRYVRVNASDSRGVCWARNKAQSLYDGEDFYLQVDSHTRFDTDWDVTLRHELECAGDKGILSMYPGQYWLNDKGKDVYGEAQTNITVPTGWHPNQMLILEPRTVKLYCQRKALALAGGFIFTHGAFVSDVPYDPKIYFIGEEVMLSIHAFTRGWNMIHPTECPLYHFYVRENATRHWTDHKKWSDMNDASVQRVTDILQGRLPVFGDVRTLDEYQAYSGINFTTYTIAEEAKQGREPVYRSPRITETTQ